MFDTIESPVTVAPAPAPATKKKPRKRAEDPTSAIRLELGAVLGRYDKAPTIDGPQGELLAPFSDEPAWVPHVWRLKKTAAADPNVETDTDEEAATVEDTAGKSSKEFELVAPRAPWVVLDRSLTLVQKRMRVAGNKAIVAMWVNNDKPMPQKGSVATEHERIHPGTVGYRVMAAHVVGGDPKRGEDVPKISSGVIAATSRKIEQLVGRLWKQEIPTVPALSAKWPIAFRPSEWRFADAEGKTIGFNFDGTWWIVELRIPRPKNKQKVDVKRVGSAARKAAYVFGALEKIMVGDADRGVPSADAPVSKTKWVPSTLLLSQPDPKQKTWVASISYRYPERPLYPAQNALVIHCGLRTFASFLDVESMLAGRSCDRIDGKELLRRRFQFRKQRQRMMREAHKFATPGRGHKARTTVGGDVERRFVDDWLRRRARRLVAIAKARKAKILISQMKDARRRAEGSGLPARVKIAVHQAPWYRFRTFIEQAAAKEGVLCESYAPRNHARRCPNPECGHVALDREVVHDLRRWLFTCPICDYSRNIDNVIIMNAIWSLAAQQRITLPNKDFYADVFKRLRKARAQAETENRKQREAAIFAGVGGERPGGARVGPKEKQRLDKVASYQAKHRSKKE